MKSEMPIRVHQLIICIEELLEESHPIRHNNSFVYLKDHFQPLWDITRVREEMELNRKLDEKILNTPIIID